MRRALVSALAVLALFASALALRAQEDSRVHLPLLAGVTATPMPTATPEPTPGPLPWRRPGTAYFALTVTDVVILGSGSAEIAVRNDTNTTASGIVVARTFYTEAGVYSSEQFQLYLSARVAPGETRRLIYLNSASANGTTTRMEAYGSPASP